MSLTLYSFAGWNLHPSWNRSAQYYVKISISNTHTPFDQSIPSLQRFFGNESESSQRLSSSIDPTSSTSDKPRFSLIDPLHAILSLASQSEDGLSRSLLYLSMLAKSSANIPTSFFVQFSKLIDFNGSNALDHANTLLKLILLCLWQTPIGRQELQSLIATLHSQLENRILECLTSGKGASVVYVGSASL